VVKALTYTHVMTTPDLPRKRRRRPKFTKERPVRQDSVQAPLRLFIAVPLPDPVRALVRTLVEEFRQEPWPIRWISPDNAHLTLHFLGEVPSEKAELLKLALPAAVARHQRFRLRTADLGVFPSQKRPRVLWLGLYGPAHRLVTLHTDLQLTLRKLDFAVDEGPFHPHITLGRVREDRNTSMRALPGQIVERIRAEAESGRVSAKNAIPMAVDSVILYQSILDKSGPTYVPLLTCPLGEPT
jgi:2'-5' RNA ligase